MSRASNDGCLRMTYVELDRRFFEVKVDALGNERESDPDTLLAMARMTINKRSWAELLEHRYVVVLGEAGAGKTKEFQARAKLVTDSGSFAFFAELRLVAAKGLRATMFPNEQRRLDSWRASESEATFFLDSLDEAKLARHSLRDALLAVQQELDVLWARVRLVVSCRPSDWMARADREAFAAVTLANDHITIAELAPLETAAVERLAQSCRVVDPPKMIDAIKERHAQVFMERPRDVAWMSAYWIKNGRIGSLSELIQQNVDEKLRETPGKPVSLSLKEATQAAAALAGISLLSRRLAFRVPNDDLDARWIESAIEPSTVLADWKSDAQQALLRLPLFDESTYGLVRIHHRSVHEYLAAKWLKELCDAGLTVRQLDDMFRVENRGERLVVPHMAPVAAWLGLWSEDVRRHLIESAPEVFLLYGDPSALSVPERALVLKSYARRYTDRNRWLDRPDGVSLSRFAAPELADAVSQLLDDANTPSGLVYVLFRLAHQGLIGGVVPAALRWALNPQKDDELRAEAMRVVAVVGADAERAELVQLRESTTSWTPDTAVQFIRATYPRHILPSDVVAVLEHTSEPSNTTTSLHVSLGDFASAGSVSQQLALISAATDSSKAHPFDVSTRAWCVPLVGEVLQHFMREGDEQHIEAVAEICDWFLQRHDEHSMMHTHDVTEALRGCPAMRRAIFWFRAREASKAKKNALPTRLSDLPYRSGATIGEADLDWLERDARTQDGITARLLAFEQFRHIVTRRPGSVFDGRLDELARSSPAFTTRIQRSLNPGRRYVRGDTRDGLEKSEATMRLSGEARAREQKRRAQARAANVASLTLRIGGIRSGADVDALVWMEGVGDGFEALEKKLGPNLANAAVDGARCLWRKQRAQFPHERGRASVLIRDIVGLRGLQSEIECGLDLGMLNQTEVESAVRHATSKSNGFPEYVVELARLYPDWVRQAFRPALEADYDSDVEWPQVLHRCAHGGASLRSAVGPVIEGLVQSRHAMGPSAQSDALALLLTVGRLSAISGVAEQRCRSAKSEKRRAAWWCAWLASDAPAAVNFLVANETSESVMAVCERLHTWTRFGVPEERTARLLDAFRADGTSLRGLAAVVLRNVRYEDDIDVNGFVNGRHEAQDVRRELLSWLVGLPDTESAKQLLLLADEPGISDPGSVRRLAEQRRVAETNDVVCGTATSLIKLYREHGLEATQHLATLRVQVTEASNTKPRIADQPTNPIYKELVEAVRKNQALFVVGTGVSRGATSAPAASWTGLIKDGLAYCAALDPTVRQWPVEHGQALDEAEKRGDPDALVHIASLVEDRLGGATRREGSFRQWLSQSVGTLEVKDPTVADLLHVLGQGRLATCNYDDVLTRDNCRPVVWNDSGAVAEILGGRTAGIVHLHGHWRTADSVVFGRQSYDALLANGAAQALQRALVALKSMVFVGFGTGLEDRNIGPLFEWMSDVLPERPAAHFRLVTEKEWNSLPAPDLSKRLIAFPYGATHADLPAFLRRLAVDAGLVEEEVSFRVQADRRKDLAVVAVAPSSKGEVGVALVASFEDIDVLNDAWKRVNHLRTVTPGVSEEHAAELTKIDLARIRADSVLTKLVVSELQTLNTAIFAAFDERLEESAEEFVARLARGLLAKRLNRKDGVRRVFRTEQVAGTVDPLTAADRFTPQSVLLKLDEGRALLEFAALIIQDRFGHRARVGDFDLMRPRIPYVWDAGNRRGYELGDTLPL